MATYHINKAKGGIVHGITFENGFHVSREAYSRTLPDGSRKTWFNGKIGFSQYARPSEDSQMMIASLDIEDAAALVEFIQTYSGVSEPLQIV